jgi:hypothetical protein
MSQILQSGAGGPPPAAGIQTITGNVGGAVGPDGGGNVDFVGAGTVTVTGNPGTNTLTITINNSGTANAQTVGAVTVNLISLAVADSQMVTITAVINGLRDTFADAYGANVIFTVYRPAGGDVTIVGAPIINANNTSLVDISGTVDVGTETARINVIGVAAQTWNWTSVYEFLYS